MTIKRENDEILTDFKDVLKIDMLADKQKYKTAALPYEQPQRMRCNMKENGDAHLKIDREGHICEKSDRRLLRLEVKV